MTNAIALDANGHVVGFIQIDDANDGDEKGPTGHIAVNGEPMAFWLPPSVTPESIGIKTTEGGKRG